MDIMEMKWISSLMNLKKKQSNFAFSCHFPSFNKEDQAELETPGMCQDGYLHFTAYHQDRDLKCWFISVLVISYGYVTNCHQSYLKITFTISVSVDQEFLSDLSCWWVFSFFLSLQLKMLGLSSEQVTVIGRIHFQNGLLIWFLAEQFSFSPHGPCHRVLTTCLLVFPQVSDG